MQKKIIALAVAGAIGSIAAGSAFADGTTMYGRLDLGYENRGNSSGLVTGATGTSLASKGEIASGIEAGSRIGIKGNEDLGDGNKAIYEVEFGIALDAPSYTSAGVTANNQSSQAYLTNRHSYVGMTGGWGTAVGGRLDGVRYGLYQKFDAFGAGGMGNITQLTAQYDRADNAVAYISPSFNDFVLTLAYSTNTGGVEGNVGGNVAAKNTNTGAPGGTATRVGNMGDDVLGTIMLGYDQGPISANLDYETTFQKGYQNSTLHTIVVGGSYDFGVAKVSAMYDTLQGDPCSNIGGYGGNAACNAAGGVTGGKYDKSLWLLSAKAPLTSALVLKASYGKLNDNGTVKVTGASNTNMGASKFGLGIDYNLSKRTNFYADYGKINNDNGAGYSISPAANAGGTGYGTSGIDFGIAHKF